MALAIHTPEQSDIQSTSLTALMQPIEFTPIIKTARWGGRLLGERLGKELGERTDYAESWEICDHPDAQTCVASGPHAGKTLSQLMQANPERLLGRDYSGSQFPLLIKYLDCNDTLSVQVHPNDEQAIRYLDGGRGKTEAWVVLEAEPQSCIYAGLKPGVTRDVFLKALDQGTVEECLHRVTPVVGDCYFVPAGTVHALGKGVLVAEIQQVSDLTFRIHDWNWVDAQGNPRQLHLNEALECIDFSRGPVSPIHPKQNTGISGWGARYELIRSSYFDIDRYRTRGHVVLEPTERCRIMMMLKGNAQLESTNGTIQCKPGSTLMLPATTPPIMLSSIDGSLSEFLIVTVV